MMLVMLVFWPVLSYDFVYWDDGVSVTHNPTLKGPWSWDLVKSFFDPQTAFRFKPLHWMVLRLVSDVGEMNPAVWHAFGLGLHAVASAGVFMALRKALCIGVGTRGDTLVAGVAWMAAAIWALHPLRAVPVAWVTGSSYPMTTVFIAWSYWAYLNAYAMDAGQKSGGRWLMVALLLAVAAYATYPISVTYVAWLMATDKCLLRRVPAQPWLMASEDVRRWWSKHIAFAVPTIIAVGATLWTRLVAPAGWYVAPSLGEVSWLERLATGKATLMMFPLKLIWPVHLTPNHAHRTVPA